jgi:hypothetical protein
MELYSKYLKGIHCKNNLQMEDNIKMEFEDIGYDKNFRY